MQVHACVTLHCVFVRYVLLFVVFTCEYVRILFTVVCNKCIDVKAANMHHTAV